MFKKIVYLLSSAILISMVMIQPNSAMDRDIGFDFDEERELFRTARVPVDPVANLLVSRMLSRASDEEDEGWSTACCETCLDLCNYSLLDSALLFLNRSARNLPVNLDLRTLFNDPLS